MLSVVSSSPRDLIAVRKAVLSLTGIADPNSVGIIGDQLHNSGYHLGRDRLISLGILQTDFSAKLDRDRRALNNNASALDIGLDWAGPHGREQAIAFSNQMVADLRAGTPGTEVLRAINYSIDGTLARDKAKRVDRQVEFRDEHSGDSVDIHTHFEFFRDTEGKRDGAFLILLRRRILQAQGKDDGMLSEEKLKGADGFERTALRALFDLHDEVILGADFGRSNGAVSRLKRVEAALAESATRERALAAAFQAITAGGAVDSAAVIQHIDQVAAVESATVQALQEQIADLKQRIAAIAEAANVTG
jgi:hypothetical protein